MSDDGNHHKDADVKALEPDKRDADVDKRDADVDKRDGVGVLRGLVLVKGGMHWEPPEKPAFIFAHPNATSEHMMKNGIFEKSLIEWAKQFLTPNTDFVDIGAHAGTYSLTLAPHCRRVFAFEAQRMTYYQLCGGVALNQYQNVWPTHCALGEKEDVINLNITSTDGGGSTLEPSVPKQHNWPILKQEPCQVKPLDSFALFPPMAALAVHTGTTITITIATADKITTTTTVDAKNNNTVYTTTIGAPANASMTPAHATSNLSNDLGGAKIGLIKIDVEGHELAVLRGAKETILKNNHPPIIFEVWPDDWFKPQKEALFQFIKLELKYSITPIRHYNNMFLATK